MKKIETLSIQEQYVKSHKKHHILIMLARLAIFISFLLIWELLAYFNIIDAFFFSSPSGVIKCAYEMLLDLSLFTHIFVTLYETIISFLLVILIGILVASLLWFSKTLSEIIEPTLVILNSLPKSALAPLFIVWLGTGTKTIIIAGISVAIFGCIISLYSGFSETDKDKLMMIETLGGSRLQAYTKVVLPNSIPVLLSTIKVNIGLSLVGVIIGEFLAARNGLGYLIIYGSQVFQLDLVIMSIVILCVIATALYKIIQVLEHQYKKKMVG